MVTVNFRSPMTAWFAALLVFFSSPSTMRALICTMRLPDVDEELTSLSRHVEVTLIWRRSQKSWRQVTWMWGFIMLRHVNAKIFKPMQIMFSTWQHDPKCLKDYDWPPSLLKFSCWHTNLIGRYHCVIARNWLQPGCHNTVDWGKFGRIMTAWIKSSWDDDLAVVSMAIAKNQKVNYHMTRTEKDPLRARHLLISSIRNSKTI